ncbi:MAG: hypothetical protein F6K55_26615 [Moorea sp. SIO4A3]|nr:hypothetical protein [Moorena sp. SIO4A3]
MAKRLYQRGYGRQDILELFRLIDWLISLADSWQTGFTKNLGLKPRPSRTAFYWINIAKKGIVRT